MTRDQFVVWFVCAGFGLWAARHAAIAAAHAMRDWWRPEPLAPKSPYDGIYR